MAAKFTLVSYSSPVWGDAAQTAINVQVIFEETGSAAIPFTASKNDVETHGVDLFNTIVANASKTPIGAYVAPTLTLADQAAAAIKQGVGVQSTKAPQVNGTYAIASGVPFGREDIAAEAQFVSSFGEFTNGTTTLSWPLIDGKTFVTFPDTATYMDFAKAAARFYATCRGIIATGSGTVPSTPVPIA